MKPIITSVLQTDTYKLTMANAVAHLYPYAEVRYEWINRGGTPFSSEMAARISDQVDMMEDLKLTATERCFLENATPFLPPTFLDILSRDKLFDRRHVCVEFHDGELRIQIEGPWYRTIFWEVPLMAIISEVYFKDAEIMPLSEVLSVATKKGMQLRAANAYFSDFGTRRRVSQKVHKEVLFGLLGGAGKHLIGTSNVRFAMEFGLRPIGTQAHEWFSYHAAQYGYSMANSMALGRWVDVYSGKLGIALTDTFSTASFWPIFGSFYARLFDGVRHDSGDAFAFGEKAIGHYQKLGINPMEKTIVFSDGLNVKLACALQKHFFGRIKIVFGIGTHFTNDVGVKPLNMVIKMVAAKPKNTWIQAIKLSDVAGKETGDPSTISLCKQILGRELAESMASE